MAPPIVYVGVGYLAGAWMAESLAASAVLSTLAAACALLLAPLAWRWRGMGAAFLLASSLPAPPGPQPDVPTSLEGQVVGAVRSHSHSISVDIETSGGQRWRLRVLNRDRMSDAQALAPCHRLVARNLRAGRGELRVRVRDLRIRAVDCSSPWRLAHDARARLATRLPAGPGFDLLAAVVLGDRSRLGSDDRIRFRRAGVSHLIAVSGLHLAVVVGLVFAASRRLWALALLPLCPTRVAAGLSLLAAASFTMVTGAAVSTVRALLMCTAVLVPMVVGKRIDALVALTLAGLWVALTARSLLIDLGFQLSMAATGILVVSLRSTAGRPRWRRWLSSSLAASAATFAITAPIAGPQFGEVAPVALLSNLLAVPVVELAVLPLGMLGLVAAELHPALGDSILHLAAVFAELALEVIAWFAAVEPWPWPGGWPWAILAVAVAVAVARWRSAGGRNALVIAVLAALLAWLTGDRSGELRVHFVAVGQGDAAVVEWPAGEVWVVDAGPVPRRSPGPVERLLHRQGVERIDRLIITHPHPDHSGGARELSQAFEIGQTWVAGSAGPELGRHRVGQASAWFMGPIFEGSRARGDPVLSVNDNSIVFLVEYAGRRILLLGDVESEGEERLVRAYPRLGGADVVKVGHHGSTTSSTKGLVAWARPLLAVISVGRNNPFGHPSQAVLDRWRRAGARTLRTDLHGTITVEVTRSGDLRALHPAGNSR